MNNNPLRQYFRRPSVYLRLPSGGKGYPPGSINIPESGELAVYPMTAIDEITSKTPDALLNGSAIVDVIKSCVPDIIDPWQVKNVDLDAILIAIRAASGSGDMEVESTCPSCKEASKYGINLAAVLSTLQSPDYSEELQISDLSIKFRPLIYKEVNETSLAQFEVQRMFNSVESLQDSTEKLKKSREVLRHITRLTMEVLVKTIEYIRTPTATVTEPEYIFDFLENCDKNIYIKLRDYNTELRNKTQLKPLEVKCVNCSNEYKQPFSINSSDFFG